MRTRLLIHCTVVNIDSFPSHSKEAFSTANFRDFHLGSREPAQAQESDSDHEKLITLKRRSSYGMDPAFLIDSFTL